MPKIKVERGTLESLEAVASRHLGGCNHNMAIAKLCDMSQWLDLVNALADTEDSELSNNVAYLRQRIRNWAVRQHIASSDSDAITPEFVDEMSDAAVMIHGVQLTVDRLRGVGRKRNVG